MDWIEELHLLSKADDNWRHWQEVLMNREEEYEKILALLTPAQREFMRDHIAICLESEYALVSIAYEIGHRHGRNGVRPDPHILIS